MAYFKQLQGSAENLSFQPKKELTTGSDEHIGRGRGSN